jgi:hypothetical protein
MCPLHLIRQALPEAEPLLAQYGLQTAEGWEPLGQALAARGVGYTAVQTLCHTLDQPCP